MRLFRRTTARLQVGTAPGRFIQMLSSSGLRRRQGVGKAACGVLALVVLFRCPAARLRARSAARAEPVRFRQLADPARPAPEHGCIDRPHARTAICGSGRTKDSPVSTACASPRSIATRRPSCVRAPSTRCMSTSRGRLWIGTADGVLVFEDGRFRALPIPGLDGGEVRSMTSDAQGRVWIGADTGLFDGRGWARHRSRTRAGTRRAGGRRAAYRSGRHVVGRTEPARTLPPRRRAFREDRARAGRTEQRGARDLPGYATACSGSAPRTVGSSAAWARSSHRSRVRRISAAS